MTLTECRLDALGDKREVAQAVARGIGKGIGDRGGHRSLRGFARAERLLGTTVEQGDESFGNFGHGQDGIAAPIPRGNAAARGGAAASPADECLRRREAERLDRLSGVDPDFVLPVLR